jgi:hypothetical protein
VTRSRTPLVIAPELRMPLDAVTHTFGIFGQKGSGKSSTAATFVEQGVGAGGRFVIADPTGVWWGLMHDGVGPGLPGIVFGGEHADVPLNPTAGKVVAEFVVQQDEYPVVVLDMKLMRKAERTKFMLDFLETLYHENREALHVVLDESHQFAPTKAMEGGDQIKLLGAVEDVVALGRSRGLGITMISQRFATLNANVREQIGTLVVHQLVGSLDRKALKGWIDANGDPELEKEALAVMAKLGVGRALVWSPSFLDFFGVVNIDAPQTFDSRATPKVGQRVKKPGKRAKVDLAVLRERMSATIEEAARNDPKKLREQVARLERTTREQAARLEAATDGKEAEKMRAEIARLERELAEAAGRPVISDKQVKDIERIVARAEKAAAVSGDAWESVRGVLVPLAASVQGALGAAKPPAAVAARPPAPAPARRDPVPRPEPTTPAPVPDLGAEYDGDVKLKAGARRILEALASHHPMRMTRSQIATIAKLKKTGGTFGSYWSSVNVAGFIEESDGTTAITQAGLDYLGVVPRAPLTPEELLAMWRDRLKKGAREMLDLLVAQDGQWVEREWLAEQVGKAEKGGTFGSYVSMLKQAGLADVDGRMIRASETLFLGAVAA